MPVGPADSHCLRELLPKAAFWPVMLPGQTPDRDRILAFRRADA